MKYRDPSGLAPEKEKHKDEVLTVSELSHPDIEQSSLMSTFWTIYNNPTDPRLITYEEFEYTPLRIRLGMGGDATSKLGNPWGKSSGAENGLGGKDGLTDGTGKATDNGLVIEYTEKTPNKDGTGYSVETRRVRYYQGGLYNEDGSAYTGTNEFVSKVYDYLGQLYNTGDAEIIHRLNTLQNSDNLHVISLTDVEDIINTIQALDQDDEFRGIPTGSITRIGQNSNIADLSHEILGHAYYYDIGKSSQLDHSSGAPMKEVIAITIENHVRGIFGMPLRNSWSNIPIPMKDLQQYWGK